MRRDDYTDIGGTGGAFLTTHWSLIQEAGSSDEQNNQALESLLLKAHTVMNNDSLIHSKLLQ
ncbi:hypothetical protein ACFL5F_04255 [Planctomycetota bacterium]